MSKQAQQVMSKVEIASLLGLQTSHGLVKEYRKTLKKIRKHEKAIAEAQQHINRLGQHKSTWFLASHHQKQIKHHQDQSYKLQQHLDRLRLRHSARKQLKSLLRQSVASADQIVAFGAPHPASGQGPFKTYIYQHRFGLILRDTQSRQSIAIEQGTLFTVMDDHVVVHNETGDHIVKTNPKLVHELIVKSRLYDLKRDGDRRSEETASSKLKTHPHYEFIHEADQHLQTRTSNTGMSIHSGGHKRPKGPHVYNSNVSLSTHNSEERHSHDEKKAQGLHSIARKHGFVQRKQPDMSHMYDHPHTGAVLNIHHPHKTFYTDKFAGYFLSTPHQAMKGNKETAASKTRLVHFELAHDPVKTWQMHGKKLLEHLSTTNDRHPLVTKHREGHDVKHDLIKHLENADPSPQKKYVPHIATMVHKGKTKLEDLGRVHTALAKWHHLSTTKKLKGDDKDLHKQVNVHHLEDTVDKYEDVKSNKEQEQKQETHSLAKNEATITKQHEGTPHGFTHIIPHTENAAKHFGKGTKWCTSGDKDNAFHAYHTIGDLHIYVPHHPKYLGEKYQAHHSAKSVRNERDKKAKLPKHMKQHFENHIKTEKEKGLDSREVRIREAAVSSPSATQEHISRGFRDENTIVRRAAVSHPNATRKHILQGLNDESFFVRQAAKNAIKKFNKETAKADETDDQIYSEFKKLTNMSPSQLDRWLESEDSKRVGNKPSGKGESIGHASGRKIIRIKTTPKDELTDKDYKHMRKVVGYIKRHSAQRPSGDVSETNWRYSLMNWGHDPLLKNKETAKANDENHWSEGIHLSIKVPEGLFTKSPEKIAKFLLGKGKKKALKRLTFYRNRAGANLTDADKNRLDKAAELIRQARDKSKKIEAMEIAVAPEGLDTPTSLNREAVDKLADEMNRLLATTIILWYKTKNFHWHVKGPNFRDLHLLFDEQATQIYETIDTIAERIRKTGNMVITSLEEARKRSQITEEGQYVSIAPRAMVQDLATDNRIYLTVLQQTHEAAVRARDVATTALIETWLDEAEKRVWFLYETAQTANQKETGMRILRTIEVAAVRHQVGDKVKAKWSVDGRYYHGTVVKVGHKNTKVKWEDGGTHSSVPHKHVKLHDNPVKNKEDKPETSDSHSHLNTAIKVRNHLKTHFDVETYRPMAGVSKTSVYDDHQKLTGHFKHSDHAKAAIEHLKKHGWTQKESAYSPGVHILHHPEHQNVTVGISKKPWGPNRMGGAKVQHYVGFYIHGPKKAKRSNLPLYD